MLPSQDRRQQQRPAAERPTEEHRRLADWLLRAYLADLAQARREREEGPSR